MKYLLTMMFTMVFSSYAIADHHALALEARIATVDFSITSIDLGSDLSVITAETDTVEYGKSYVSYHLTYNRDGNSGSYTVQARGFADESATVSAFGAGIWTRDGHLVVMTGTAMVSDGSLNLDKITLDPLKRTLTADIYALN
jgi:hypothetical protein